MGGGGERGLAVQQVGGGGAVCPGDQHRRQAEAGESRWGPGRGGRPSGRGERAGVG